jgi:hypothetical protein
MKTFFRNFSILAIIGSILIAISSCSEDIWVHDGADGADGENGLTSLMHFDKATQTKIYYLDKDRNLRLTAQDSILYQESKEGFLFVPVGDCIELYKTVGTAEIFVGSICDGVDGGIGPQGPAGNDGSDGQDGNDGNDGEAGIVVFSVVPDTINCKSGMRVIMTSLQGGEEISSVSFCVPADGEDGTTVVQTDTIVVIDSVYVFNTDTIVQIDSVFVVGLDTTVETYQCIPLPDISEDFNHEKNSGHYRDKGHLFSSYVSVNGIGSPYKNGTVEVHDRSQDTAFFWTYEFPEGIIGAVELDIDSKDLWEVKMSFQRSDGLHVPVMRKVIGGNQNLVWYDHFTYGEGFSYQADLNKLPATDITRVIFYFYKLGPWSEDNRNCSFNIDNMRISRFKIEKVN